MPRHSESASAIAATTRHSRSIGATASALARDRGRHGPKGLGNAWTIGRLRLRSYHSNRLAAERPVSGLLLTDTASRLNNRIGRAPVTDTGCMPITSDPDGRIHAVSRSAHRFQSIALRRNPIDREPRMNQDKCPERRVLDNRESSAGVVQFPSDRPHLAPRGFDRPPIGGYIRDPLRRRSRKHQTKPRQRAFRTRPGVHIARGKIQ